jgi:hypothetical protein
MKVEKFLVNVGDITHVREHSQKLICYNSYYLTLQRRTTYKDVVQ